MGAGCLKSGRRHDVTQDKGKDAAVSVVVDFDVGIDAERQIDGF
jgi:hypothetical protein